MGVEDGEAQVGVDEDDAPGGVLEEGFAERDGAFEVDLGVDLAEGAVDPGGFAVGAADGRGLGADQDAAAVAGEEGDVVDLAAAFGGDAEEAVFDVGGVAGADGPAA